jgi:hypothetical protein
MTCAGEFVVVNQHLLHDLTRLGLWDTDMKNEIVAASGSVAVSDNAPYRAVLEQLSSATAVHIVSLLCV